MNSVICWFRKDLRVRANSMLEFAKERNLVPIPIFILSPNEKKWPDGEATRWWLHQSLKHLKHKLDDSGLGLSFAKGEPLDQLVTFCQKAETRKIVCHRLYEPHLKKKDYDLQKSLKEKGIDLEFLEGNVLFAPGDVLNKSDQPYKVFTPFWRTIKDIPIHGGSERPLSFKKSKKKMDSLKLNELGLLPKVKWFLKLEKHWQPGEDHSRQALKEFLKEDVLSYPSDRDCPSIDGTSQMSMALHFGELSAWQVWQHGQACLRKQNNKKDKEAVWSFLRQLGWREFSLHLLHFFPRTESQPLDEKFKRFPWRKNKKAFQKWQQGQTGYPIVDAGMRQLWETGWMHNRVRMIVASFLTKDLLIPWQQGAEWFWDTLVDANLANNTMGWQWTAGCGADASPFFRIFNPIRQGEKFDPDGAYVKKWVPELKNVPIAWIHKPFEASEEQRKVWGIELGKQYPYPMVDHAIAREQALELYQRIKKVS